MELKKLLFGTPQTATEIQACIYPNSLQAWLPIADIREGVIITQDGGYVKLLEILPVNFRLQSDEEQARMIGCFAAWLKIAPNNIQILCAAQSADMTPYETRMKAYLEQETDPQCRAMIKDNIKEVKYLSAVGARPIRFYLSFRYEPQMRLRAEGFDAIADALYDEECTARSYLGRCGLEVVRPDYADNAVVGAVYAMLCKHTSQRLRLPLYFRTMLEKIHGNFEEETDA